MICPHCQRPTRKVKLRGGPPALRKRARGLDTGEFTQAQMAEMLGVTIDALKYALTPPSKRAAKKERQRRERQDPEHTRIETLKRRIRREAARGSDGRTKAQKCRDAAVGRPRNALGQLLPREARP